MAITGVNRKIFSNLLDYFVYCFSQNESTHSVRVKKTSDQRLVQLANAASYLEMQQLRDLFEDELVHRWTNKKFFKNYVQKYDKITHFVFYPEVRKSIETKMHKKLLCYWLKKVKIPSQTLPYHYEIVAGEFDPAGKKIAVAAFNKKIYIDDLTNPKVHVTELNDHGKEARSLAFNPQDSRNLMSASFDGELIFWKLHKESFKSLSIQTPITALACSHAGDKIAIGTSNNLFNSKGECFVQVRSLKDKSVLFQIPAPEKRLLEPIYALAFNNDDSKLAIGCEGSILVIDKDGNLLGQYADEENVCSITKGGVNFFLRGHRLEKLAKSLKIDDLVHVIMNPSKDFEQIAVFDKKKNIMLFDVDENVLLATIRKPDNRDSGLFFFDALGNLLAIKSNRNKLIIYDLSTFNQIYKSAKRIRKLEDMLFTQYVCKWVRDREKNKNS